MEKRGKREGVTLPRSSLLPWGSSGVLARRRRTKEPREVSNVDDALWLTSRAYYKPIVECCDGTDLASTYVAGSLLQPQAFGTFSSASMSVDFVILDEDGHAYPNDKACIGVITSLKFSSGGYAAVSSAASPRCVAPSEEERRGKSRHVANRRRQPVIVVAAGVLAVTTCRRRNTPRHLLAPSEIERRGRRCIPIGKRDGAPPSRPLRVATFETRRRSALPWTSTRERCDEQRKSSSSAIAVSVYGAWERTATTTPRGSSCGFAMVAAGVTQRRRWRHLKQNSRRRLPLFLPTAIGRASRNGHRSVFELLSRFSSDVSELVAAGDQGDVFPLLLRGSARREDGGLRRSFPDRTEVRHLRWWHARGKSESFLRRWNVDGRQDLNPFSIGRDRR
nr:probable acyl-activating enzyme 18, peroxisomal [Ipomoea trifida]